MTKREAKPPLGLAITQKAWLMTRSTLNNAHPLLKVLAPIVLDQVRFVRVFFCHHGIANYNGNGFILCRLSVMPMTSTAGQAHP
jgi:hypothetical protein